MRLEFMSNEADIVFGEVPSRDRVFSSADSIAVELPLMAVSAEGAYGRETSVRVSLAMMSLVGKGGRSRTYDAAEMSHEDRIEDC